MHTSIATRAVRLAQRRPGATVLAATSSQSDQKLFRSILPAAGWRVECVSSGRDALRYLWRNRVFVVICDAALPDGAWHELFEEASNLDPAPSFIVAAAPGEWFQAPPFAQGKLAFVAKPYREEQVLAATAAALEHKPKRPVRSEVDLCPVSG